MGELNQEETAPTSLPISSKKKQLMTSAMKRTSEWIFSQEIPSDITIQAGGASFTLHKFPLVSKCGHIRKSVSGETDADLSVIELPDIPGGADGFELAAKFCYGINFEINTDNIAMLRCVAEYLEMTEDYAVGNLVSRAESYLNEVAMTSLAGAVTVLHLSESLLPMAEKVKLMIRCIDAIAYIACKESLACLPGRGENNNETAHYNGKSVVDWWAEDLTVLRIDIFQRVLMAMIARGFKQYALGPLLILYAQKSLRGLDIFGRGRKKIDPKQEHEKRVVLETIVSLLPREKNAMSVSFLSMLLRAAIYLETTVACRLDLEKRMGMQLGQAVLDDLLIPSYSFTGDTLFDVDTVQRIMMNYLEYEMDGTRFSYGLDDDFVSPPPPSDMDRVGKLMESYLAEIASDRNLSVSRLIGLAELIPEQARITEDGMYRAIDIYMKAHPALSDMERKKVCSLMDCQKLSREACAHAAQNDRLPVQTVVQVLYYEQQRLRDVMDGNLTGGESPARPQKVNLQTEDYNPAPNELSRLRRENEDLKIELARTRMRVKELEKASVNNTPTVGSPTSTSRMRVKELEIASGNNTPIIGTPTSTSSGKPPLPPRKSFISSAAKKLGRLVRNDVLKSSDAKGRTKPAKDRRHSIS
ncbi:BTB/POZ domain-containing protein sr1ip1 [Ranunculus cassubicifolius]